MAVTPVRLIDSTKGAEEKLVGKNSPTLPDVLNRPLQDVLSGSGYKTDGTDFAGFQQPLTTANVTPSLNGAATATDADVATTDYVVALLNGVMRRLGLPSLGKWLNARRGIYSVADYGADATGATDSTTAIANAETARAAGARLYFPPGTYKINTAFDGSAAQKANLLKVTKAGAWDFARGATLLWGSALNLGTGTDGGALAMLNVLTGSNGFAITGGGVFDGATHVQYALAFNGDVAGPGARFDVTLQNLKEPATWAGIQFAVSADIGGTLASRAKNISGTLIRPACPIWDIASNSIVDHRDVTAMVIGGTNLMSNFTSTALVQVGTEMQTVHMMLHTMGVLNFLSGRMKSNNGVADWGVYDLGCYVIEQYGPHYKVTGTAAPTWGATIAVDSNDGDVYFVTATSNIAATVSVPTTPPVVARQYAEKRFVFYNNSGGALTTPIAFAAGYKVSGTVAPANGQRITVSIGYDQVNNVWFETGRSAAV